MKLELALRSHQRLLVITMDSMRSYLGMIVCVELQPAIEPNSVFNPDIVVAHAHVTKVV